MLHFFLSSRDSSVGIVAKIRAHLPMHHGPISNKVKNSAAFWQPWDLLSLLLTYRALKPRLKMNGHVPPVHTPSRRAREKRYLILAYFCITVLSNSAETYNRKSVFALFKYEVRFDVWYGFFGRLIIFCFSSVVTVLSSSFFRWLGCLFILYHIHSSVFINWPLKYDLNTRRTYCEVIF
jgi:hypothetical protein